MILSIPLKLWKSGCLTIIQKFSDPNPIEHLWEYLDKKIRDGNISSKDHLKAVLHNEYNKSPPNFTKKLVDSMPRWLSAVIKLKGLQTKY